MRRHVTSLSILAYGLIAAASAQAIGRGGGRVCASSEANPYVGTYRNRGEGEAG